MILLEENKKAILLGNEAIARGAIEAGVDFVTTYPGTPASEISDAISLIAREMKKIGKEPPFYFEYSVNEKVALEMAAAAAISGLRALTSMKHVGMNVASDALMTYAYVGCKGGHVIVTGDDPSCHSSQNEQDNRCYAKFANLPMLEPSSPAEAKEMTMEAFKISEELHLPVILRETTRVAHTRGVVELGRIDWSKRHGEFRHGDYVTVPEVARKLHPVLLEKMEKAKEMAEKSEFNRIEGSGSYGIITSGVSYTYVKEALHDLNANAKILKLGFTNPLPSNMILNFMKSVDKILIIEELEPYLEEQIKKIAYENELDVKIYGKGFEGLSRIYEYTPFIVYSAIAKFMGIEYKIDKIKVNTAPRPPVLCPGCPHRATYYAVKSVAPPDTIYPTDIGCYTLGLLPPYKTADFLLCMGSSVGSGGGFSIATGKKVISFIGDSTFFHAGLPALINALYHNHNFTIAILDNSTTAMTGHQPHPGSSINGMGNPATPIDIAKLVKGMGVKHVEVVNPYNLKATKEAFKRALEYEGLSVVIAKAPCILLDLKRRRKRITFEVVQEKCTRCQECINNFACPAFYRDGEQIKINDALCTGCGFCVQVCPEGAIKIKKEVKNEN
ncbi:MAG: indolepyruvate ferredoxin oxidoreductase subunit alpha [Thermoplasmata archaeon]|nr:MAG: indolepyruvate ferredoxin oxidoreductase subunit alpha [Thermoplasmata archaeon]